MLTAVKATGPEAGYNRLGGQGFYVPGAPKVLLFHVPGLGPAVPRQLDSALGLGTSEQASPWGSPYKAMGLGTQHAWVRGGHSARAMSRELSCPQGLLPGDNPS